MNENHLHSREVIKLPAFLLKKKKVPLGTFPQSAEGLAGMEGGILKLALTGD